MSAAAALGSPGVGGAVSWRFVAAALLPFATALVQWLIWPWIQPFVWFLFFPTVLLGARIGGFRGGLACTAVSVAVVWFVFLPPEFSWKFEGVHHYWSVPLFTVMGYFVSRQQAHLDRARQQTNAALGEARRANDALARLNERARTAGREIAGRFDAMFEQAAFGLALADPDGRWLRVNDRMCEIVGYDRSTLLSLTFQDITHPDDTGVDREWGERLLGGHVASGALEKRYIRGDGEAVWIQLTVSLQRKPDGTPDYYIAVVEDIEARKRAEDALRQSEAAFRKIFEEIATGIVITDPEGNYERCNPAFTRITGYSDAELRGKHRSELIHPDDLAANESGLRRLLSGEQPALELENRFLRRAGEPVWVRKTVSLMPGVGGSPAHVIALVTDVSELRQARLNLMESESRFRRFFELAPIPMSLVGTDERMLALNRRFVEVLGYSVEDIPTLAEWRRRAFPDPAYRAAADASWKRGVAEAAARGGPMEPLERQVLCRDGSVRHFSVSGIPLPDGILVTLPDITDRKRAEAALQMSQERLRTFIRYAPISIAMFDLEMNYLATSGRWVEEFGRGRADLVGCNHYEVYPDLPPAWKAVYRQAMAGARLHNDEDRWPLADGGQMWLRWTVLPWRDEDGRIGGIVIFSEDITDRKAMESVARETRERLQAIFDSAMDGILSVDDEHRIRGFNPAAGAIFGVDPATVIGEPLTRFLPDRFRDMHAGHMRQFALSGATARRMGALGEVAGLHADGREVPLEVSISCTAGADGNLFTAIVRDVSDRKHADAALQELRHEMERMQTVQVASQTAAAIAHELNQPLNAVTSYSEAALRLLRAGNPKPDRLMHAIAGSADQAQRAGRVMRELMDFLHNGDALAEVVDLRAAVERAIAIVAGGDTSRGMIDVTAEPGLGPVRGLHVRIEKVLVNLIRNAAEAMASAGTPDPRIHIRLRALDERMADVEVSDNGPGLTEEMARHAFDPFYTTKPRGVGMGLAISRSLVESQGGRLWVENRTGAGATFRFTLPFTG